jgi:hypothetical protein
MYRVMKPIQTGEATLSVGMVVDASSWRNLRALVNMRYLAPVLESERVAAEASKPKKAAKPKVEAEVSTEE